MSSTGVDVLRTQEDDHSPSAIPVLAALGLATRVGDVKGDDGGISGDGAPSLTVVVEAVGWKRIEGH